MACSEYTEMDYTESGPVRAHVCVCIQVERLVTDTGQHLQFNVKVQ